MHEATAENRFWTEYQPGFRLTSAEVGSPEFFSQISRRRYELEPDIEEQVRFDSWSGADVLEAGCGIGTDAERFVAAGARYTGVDLSSTAIELATHRFAASPTKPRLVRASVTELPFADESFDLVYSNGVIHHIDGTQAAIDEFRRVLRPGGSAVVMLYHRSSLNYHLSIMVLRRLLAGLLLIPGVDRLAAALTGEGRDVLEGHKTLLQEHGLRYLRDRQLFLSHNTDGPGNPLSKVYTRVEAERLFTAYEAVDTEVRWLNVRAYPGGERLESTALARSLGRRVGWHLWIHARA